jgi:hypothetical protein
VIIFDKKGAQNQFIENNINGLDFDGNYYSLGNKMSKVFWN